MDWLKNWFSNFEPFDKMLAKEGLLYNTVEHYFVAHKTKDRDLRAKIAAMNYPAQAKKYGQQLKVRLDWNNIKESVMYDALLWKFRPETYWSKVLINSNPVDLIEWNNWHDNYWGWCICKNCLKKEKLNRLGYLIMKIREEVYF